MDSCVVCAGQRVPRWMPAHRPSRPLPPQYIFAALYLATQAAAMALYIRAASLPPWSLALLCASRRLHSIFVLRLFNDCWAMAAAYLATLALQARRPCPRLPTSLPALPPAPLCSLGEGHLLR